MYVTSDQDTHAFRSTLGSTPSAGCPGKSMSSELQLRWTRKELTAGGCLLTALCSWVASPSCGVGGGAGGGGLRCPSLCLSHMQSTSVSFLVNTLDCNLLVIVRLLPRTVS